MAKMKAGGKDPKSRPQQHTSGKLPSGHTALYGGSAGGKSQGSDPKTKPMGSIKGRPATA